MQILTMFSSMLQYGIFCLQSGILVRSEIVATKDCIRTGAVDCIHTFK